jgi:fermentation-respiration switch protein FrsA (DUF1100 family)
MRGVLIGAGVLATLYVLVVAALVLLQRRILFPSDNTRPDLARVPVAGVREITVTTPDGLSLLGWFMPPASDSAPVALCLHGNAGHIGHRAYRLAPFQRLGWGVLMLEYRGYGGNPGHPSETGLLIDARAGYAALRAMNVPPERILLWGESLGSGLAARLAAEQPVAAVFLEAPYTSITDIARARFPYAPVRWLLRDHFDTMRVIADIHVPVFVMHGVRDRTIPVAMGRAVYEAAHQPKELWIAPDAGHADLIEAGAIAAAGEFLNRVRR